jgi:periodic tryptophan protein 1
MTSMITTTAWVPRGAAAPFPKKYAFDEEEFERIVKLAELQLDDAKDDLEDAEAKHNGEDNDQQEEKTKTTKSGKGDVEEMPNGNEGSAEKEKKRKKQKKYNAKVQDESDEECDLSIHFQDDLLSGVQGRRR